MKKHVVAIAIALGLTMTACSDMVKDPLVIGHRGAMGHETENTIASVEKALELGVDMIEIDVFRIRSGEIMVFHDDRVDRLTNGVGPIEAYTVVTARNLIVEGNHRIPLLQEVLKTVDKKAMLNIELKGANTSDRVNFIIDNYIKNQGWTLDQFLISSFNWEELRSMRQINPDIAIAVLTERDPLDALATADELNAVAINPYYKMLNKDNVKQIQAAGYKVYTWTVNESDDMDKMKEIGVDGIISDFPERIK